MARRVRSLLLRDGGRRCWLYLWLRSLLGQSCPATAEYDPRCDKEDASMQNPSSQSQTIRTPPTQGWMRGCLPMAVFSGLFDCSPVAPGGIPKNQRGIKTNCWTAIFGPISKMRGIGGRKNTVISSNFAVVACSGTEKAQHTSSAGAGFKTNTPALARKHRCASERERRLVRHSRTL